MELDKFKLVVNAIPGLFVIMDLEHKFILSNQTTSNLFGYQSETNMLGINPFGMKCAAVECAPQFIEQNSIVFKSETALTILDIHPYADGKIHSLLTNKVPLYDKHKKLYGVMCHCTEIQQATLTRLSAELTVLDNDFREDKKSQQGSYILDDQSFSQLSARERECLFFLVRGKSARKIAAILQLSPRTIEMHIEKLKNKLNCNSKSELIDYAFNQNFINYVPRSLVSRNVSIII